MHGGVVEDVADGEAVFDGGLADDFASAENEVEALLFQKSLRQIGHDPLEAVADQHQVSQRGLVPVGPQEVVCEVLRAMREVKNGAAIDWVLPLFVAALDGQIEPA